MTPTMKYIFFKVYDMVSKPVSKQESDVCTFHSKLTNISNEYQKYGSFSPTIVGKEKICQNPLSNCH